MIIKQKLTKLTNSITRYGLIGTCQKFYERKFAPWNTNEPDWEKYLPTDEELEAQRRQMRENPFEYNPLISIVVPTYETPERFLGELLDSVVNQTYGNWELVLADGSKSDKVEQFVEKYVNRHSLRNSDTINHGDGSQMTGKIGKKIRYHRLEKNAGISENTNVGLSLAAGEYIGFADHDDVLGLNALYENVMKLNELTPEERKLFISYSDEDKIDAQGTKHYYFHHKLDYNEELIRHYNYFCHFVMVSRAILDLDMCEDCSGLVDMISHKTGGLNPKKDGAQDYDFVLRCLSAGAKAYHIPKVLYHWRVHETSTAGSAGSKMYAYEAGVKAVSEYLERRGVQAKVAISKDLGIYDVEYILSEESRAAKIVYKDEVSDDIIQDAARDEDADYIMYIPAGRKCKDAEYEEKMLAVCQEKDVAAVALRLVKGNKVVQTGIGKAYRGYFNRNELPMDVQDVPVCTDNDSIVLIKTKAWKKPGYRMVQLNNLDAEIK